jgi:hypothetical protein
VDGFSTEDTSFWQDHHSSTNMLLINKTNPTWLDLASNPVRCGGKPATNSEHLVHA